MPSQSFIEAPVHSERVQEYVLMNKFRQRIYVITEIKIAIGARVFTSYMQERSFDASPSVDATVRSVPIATGPQFETKGGNNTAVEFEDADDFVFVFSMRQIKVKKTGEVKLENFKDGDFFRLGDPTRKLHVSDQDQFHAVGLADDDAGGGEFGLEEMDAIEDKNGERCICIKLEK